jgi:hypothetical protein
LAVSDALVEAALRDLGRHLAWPATPDVTAAVRAELDRGAEVKPLYRRPVRRAVVLAAAALLVVMGALVAVSPGLRAAVLRLFSLPGVRIEVRESPPASPATTTGDVRSLLGREVSLAEARREVEFPVAVPASLGRPDEAFVLGSGPRALVTLAYGAAPGIPADPEIGYAALLTQFRGRPTEDLVKKVTRATDVTPVIIDGQPGYFVEGPHLVYVRAPGGVTVPDEPRLAGNTVLWARGPVTLRLEVDLPLAEALAVARTVR